MANQPMKFYLLEDDIYFPNRWHLGEIEPIENWPLTMGTTPALPAPLPRLKVEVYQDGAEMDYTTTGGYGIPIVSSRLKNALGTPPGIRYLPVEIAGHADKGPHFAMVIQALVDCIDESRSEFEQFTPTDPVRPDKAGDYKAFFHLALDTEKAHAAGSSVFRLAKYDIAIVVNEVAMQALTSPGLTGIHLVELQ